MAFIQASAGLVPEFQSPPTSSVIDDTITEEAGVRPPDGAPLHVTSLVQEGDLVARGAAVACLRDAPDICFVTPLAGRVARISLLPGRALSEIVIFREADNETTIHDTGKAGKAAGLRRLMPGAGLWPLLRRRPFGGMPDRTETPGAIVVMAADTQPFAPDPRLALEGCEDAFNRGLGALAKLTDGPVFVVCDQTDWVPIDAKTGDGRIQKVVCGHRHPQGAPGIRIHDLCPAGLDTPVWDIHAEDTAALGALLETGVLPMKRLVRIAGNALRETRTVRTHPGADLRQLTQRIVAPGPHVLMSGSPLDGKAARWLGTRHRQITVLPRKDSTQKRHWLIEALTGTARATPAIPTAALTHAFGGTIPAISFIRALSAGDDETAMKLGVLSLLEEDVALADYVLSDAGRITSELRGMLNRIRTEFAA